MEQIVIVLSSFLFSTAIFIFFVVKGGFNRKYLYTDNIVLGAISAFFTVIMYQFIDVSFLFFVPFINGLLTLILFICLFFYRFFRNPPRIIPGDSNDIVSGADGRIIYIKELEKNQLPVSVKKLRLANISEITKTDILKQPCYLIGIAMTLFDVHINRSPIDGQIILVKHTSGTAIGLNTPVSTIENERNTLVIKRNDGIMTGIVQIAARWVDRCILSASEGENVKKGQIIGKIRWGSQLDMIIPRNSMILVREGEQVFGGSTIIARYLGNDINDEDLV
jgi:phosphatidylserine decarboxylase